MVYRVDAPGVTNKRYKCRVYVLVILDEFKVKFKWNELFDFKVKVTAKWSVEVKYLSLVFIVEVDLVAVAVAVVAACRSHISRFLQQFHLNVIDTGSWDADP